MNKTTVSPQVLLNEIYLLNGCINDYIQLVGDQLPQESPLHSIGVLIMEHHDAVTACLQKVLTAVRFPLAVQK